MVSRSHSRGWWEFFGLVATLAVVVGFLSLVPAVREWEVRLTDTLFRLAPAPPQRSQVVIVTIDEKSLRRYGRWPWSRTLLSGLIDNASRAGATAIGLDVLVSEPQSAGADSALEHAIASSGRVVVVDKIGNFPDGPRWIEPLPQIAAAATAVGHTHAVLDSDSICRRFQPRELTLDGVRWALALEVARKVNPGAVSRFLVANRIFENSDSTGVATAPPTLLRIAFRKDGFDTVPAASVLDDPNLPAIKGRPVLIGFGPTDIGDRVSTPLAKEVPVPGVEVHAQILDSILTGRIVRESTLWTSATTVLFACVLVVAAFRRWHGIAAVLIVFALAAATYGVSLLAFVWTSRILPVGPLLLTALLGPLLVYAADFVMVERSVTNQLTGLRSWLSLRGHASHIPDKADLSWRLEVLQSLQAQLGSRYELDEALLDASQDLIAIFDKNGGLLLSNKAFAANPELGPRAVLTLEELRSRVVPSKDVSPVRLGAVEESEVYLGPDLYSMRIGPLPPTTISPGGGTIVTLTSLRTRVERDRARAEALGFITHELRTPLASIQGHAELMMQQPLSSISQDAPETIYRESKRLLALISSYLDVLRLDAGAKPLATHVIDMEAVVYQVFDILQPLATPNGMNLVADIPKPVTLVGDAPLISGAVLNLVSNAIKYGRPGTDIRVCCRQHQEEVVLSVLNQGPAISEQEIPRLFDPYYRASSAETSRSGWGLGLAFVKRIAEKHGGYVTAESQSTGTIFEIHLRNRAEVPEEAKEQHEEHPAS